MEKTFTTKQRLTIVCIADNVNHWYKWMMDLSFEKQPAAPRRKIGRPVTALCHGAILLLGCTVATPALAQWYVGADAGANLQSGASSGDRTGYVLQWEAGYDFGGPKAELEIADRNLGLANRVSSLSVMINAHYAFLAKEKWHPFVGLGLGGADTFARWSDSDGRTAHDSDWVLAYQAFAGVGYDLDRHWQITAQYRYFATQAPQLTSASGHGFDAENHNHALMAGIVYKFGAAAPVLPSHNPDSMAQANPPTPPSSGPWGLHHSYY